MKEIIREIAAKRGVKPDAIRKWHERGAVPHNRRLEFLAYATRRGLPLSERDFNFPKKEKGLRGHPPKARVQPSVAA